jgi:hypothetical protein
MAAYYTFSGQEDAAAYAIVGWFMGALVSIVSSLVLLSNLVRSTFIGMEDLADWTISDDIVPGLYLGLLILLLTPVIIKNRKQIRRSMNKGEVK